MINVLALERVLLKVFVYMHVVIPMNVLQSHSLTSSGTPQSFVKVYVSNTTLTLSQ